MSWRALRSVRDIYVVIFALLALVFLCAGAVVASLVE